MHPTARQQTSATFLWIASIFVAFQVLKFLLLVPEAETGGDAAQKWNLARDIADGSLQVFRTPEIVSHHYLRWGSWMVPAFLMWLTSDDIVIYYLSTALPSTIAAVIFLWVFFRNFGAIPTATFAVLWYFDPQIYRATFQLLPTGAGLLPLAVIVLTLQKFADGRLSSPRFAGLMALWLFWLYGAKETNIFFAPGLFLAIWALTSARYAFGFALTFAALYVVEAMALGAMLGRALPGGRMIELLLGDAVHLKGMTEFTTLIEEQEALWDAGILSRWYSMLPFHIPIYLLSIAAFITLSVRHLRTAPVTPDSKVAYGIALTALSFVLLTSFFIVSLDPVRLGQPLRSRYLAILLPLSYFALFHMFTGLRHRRVALGGVAGLVLIALSFAIGNLMVQGRFRSDFLPEVRDQLLFDDAQPLRHWIDYYAWFGEVLPADWCTPDRLEFRRNTHARMFVSSRHHGAGWRATARDCPQAAN